ncbi:MAG: EAL domain-containing protein, partial [Chloroflexota bacterium]
INLSMRNLQDPELPERIAELLEELGLSAGWLKLEITESVIMANPARTMDVLNRLHAMGVGLSIDDFGTGYSSLSYLKRLPVDELKIDKSFVMDMAHDENDATIVRSIVELAHNLGLRVVAEGVCDQRVWDLLADLGCDSGQGYHMGCPMPATTLEHWLHESPYGMA